MKINWREVFKFLSGAAFVGSITNFYLYINDIAIPFLGYTFTTFLAVRAAIGFVLFLIFFYFGYLKK